MTDTPRATVIVTSRDRWQPAPHALSRLLDRTDPRHRVIVVDGGAPRNVSRAFAETAATGRVEVVRRARFLGSNEARALALDQGVADDWIAFVESDSIPDHGWIDDLIAAAIDTGAATTFPVYLMDVDGRRIVHGAGCDLEITGEPGRTRLREIAAHRNAPWPGAAAEIVGEPKVQCEPHCFVIRRDALDRMNGVDPELRGWFEHIDLALHHIDLDIECRLVPEVTCLYEDPDRLDPRDVSSFLLRWGADWLEHSKAHMCTRWGLDPDDPKWKQHERYRATVRRSLMIDGRNRTNAALDRAIRPIEWLNARRWDRARRREHA